MILILEMLMNLQAALHYKFNRMQLKLDQEILNNKTLQSIILSLTVLLVIDKMMNLEYLEYQFYH